MTEQRIVAINAVHRNKRIVDITVHTVRGSHRIGHLPIDGWFCVCSRGKKCPHIDYVKQLVPPMEQP